MHCMHVYNLCCKQPTSTSNIKSHLLEVHQQIGIAALLQVSREYISRNYKITNKGPIVYYVPGGGGGGGRGAVFF